VEEKELIERLVGNEQLINRNTEKLEEHAERLQKLENNTAILEKMDYRMGNVETNISEIRKDIQNSKEQKRYEVG
jgi:hypothetical protein